MNMDTTMQNVYYNKINDDDLLTGRDIQSRLCNRAADIQQFSRIRFPQRRLKDISEMDKPTGYKRASDETRFQTSGP